MQAFSLIIAAYFYFFACEIFMVGLNHKINLTAKFSRSTVLNVEHEQRGIPPQACENQDVTYTLFMRFIDGEGQPSRVILKCPLLLHYNLSL